MHVAPAEQVLTEFGLAKLLAVRTHLEINRRWHQDVAPAEQVLTDFRLKAKRRSLGFFAWDWRLDR